MAVLRPVIWSADARADLDDIWTYYEQVAGQNTAEKIARQIEARRLTPTTFRSNIVLRQWREAPMRCFVVGLVISVLANTSASAAFYTYAQWDALPEFPRAAYVAGAYDSLIGFSTNDADTRMGIHYFECIRRSQMNNGQLAENVRAFARARPEFQKTVQAALGRYLFELCGAPTR